MKVSKINLQSTHNKGIGLNHTKPTFASSSWQIQEDDEFVKIPKKRYKIGKAIEYIVTGILLFELLATIFKDSPKPPKL